LTARGWVFFATAGFFAWWGFQERDIVLWGWSWTVLILGGILLLCTIFGWLAVSKTERRKATPPKLEADGKTHSTGFELSPLLNFLPIQVSCKWISPDISAFGGNLVFKSGEEKVSFGRRGYFEDIERLILLSDLLGLFRIRRKLTSKSRETLVLPAHTKRRNFGQLKSASSVDIENPEGKENGDFFDMRQYREGDSARHMLWKIWARTMGQRKYVRTPERVLDPGFAIYLFSHETDEANARLIKSLTDNERDWWFGVITKQTGGEDELKHTYEKSEVSRLLARSGSRLANRDSVDSSQLRLYEEFQIQANSQKKGLCLIFFPPGGENRFPINEWESKTHVQNRKIIIGHFEGDETLAKTTESKFQGMTNTEACAIGIPFRNG
jgi:hypothetical protein